MWKQILILVVLMLPIAYGIDQCQDRLTPGKSCLMFTPTMTCDGNYSILNDTEVVRNGSMTLVEEDIYTFVFNESAGKYIINLCDNSTREVFVEGEDDMASLSITIFILIVTFALFLLPFVKRFCLNEWLNNLLSRACWVIAIYLMMLNTAMIATIAGEAGLPLTQELFRYMWLFGMAGYVFMGYFALRTFFDTIELWKITKLKKRMGEE